MTHDYAYHLGGLVANLQSLEFLLRAFLQQLPSARPMGIPGGTDLYSFPVGATVPENELTSYDNLGQLIDKYNVEARRRGIDLIDRDLVELRDALAHGRLSAPATNDYMRLLKFSKPNSGCVTVTFNAVLDEDWFKRQKRRVADAMRAVRAVMPA
jgi:hypothetical protein